MNIKAWELFMVSFLSCLIGGLSQYKEPGTAKVSSLPKTQEQEAISPQVNVEYDGYYYWPSPNAPVRDERKPALGSRRMKYVNKYCYDGRGWTPTWLYTDL